jgi:hypothetical protein
MAADVCALAARSGPTVEPASADDRLRLAARSGSVEAVSRALVEGARDIDAAIDAAVDCGHAAALRTILERSYLAKTIGCVASVLHRPNLSAEARTRAARLLLQDSADGCSARQFCAAVCAVLCAGAVLREGPLLLGVLVADGHLDAAFPPEPERPAPTHPGPEAGTEAGSLTSRRARRAASGGRPRMGSRAWALASARTLNEQADRISWSAHSTLDAVVCDTVRVRVRRRYRGYRQAGEQLRLLILAGNGPYHWTPEAHVTCYPDHFRRCVLALLLCAQRSAAADGALGGVYRNSDALLSLVGALAWRTFWAAPEVDLEGGEEVLHSWQPGQPLHKMRSYCAK